MRALLDLLDLLWPRHCLACGVLVPSDGGDANAIDASGKEPGESTGASAATAPPLGLCSDCRRRLVAVDPSATCRTCAFPLPGLPAERRQVHCGRCLAAPPAFDRLTALWHYETPLKEVVQAFKFGRTSF
ncbi:MAG: hypothetical protein ABIU84_01160 [Thermoanaerobaculia bacterium]